MLLQPIEFLADVRSEIVQLSRGDLAAFADFDHELPAFVANTLVVHAAFRAPRKVLMKLVRTALCLAGKQRPEIAPIDLAIGPRATADETGDGRQHVDVASNGVGTAPSRNLSGPAENR